jgi:hypothetical protein
MKLKDFISSKKPVFITFVKINLYFIIMTILQTFKSNY